MMEMNLTRKSTNSDLSNLNQQLHYVVILLPLEHQASTRTAHQTPSLSFLGQIQVYLHPTHPP